MLAGAAFLSRRADTMGLAALSGRAGVARSRYLGNCLAELDSFLGGLLDALAPDAPSGRHNNALKLAKLGDGGRFDGSDHWRLRAIGRSRACLRYCAGTVRTPDARALDWMTAGWIDPTTGALRRYALGERLAPGGGDIVDICRFYDSVHARLLHTR